MATHTRPELVWVRYNPRQAHFSTRGLTLVADAAHRRLCDHIWSGGPWPAPDASKAGLLIGVPRESWDSILEELKSVGWRTRNGHLYNRAVAAVRAEAQAFQRACHNRTKAATAARALANTDRNDPPSGPTSRPASPPPSRPPSNISNSTVQDIDKAVNTAERLTLSSAPPKEGADRENDFLEQLVTTFERFSPEQSTVEMKNWGGWWRNRFRENPSKAKRVLAEVGCMVKERRIKRNPGAAGLDLWNRLP